MLRIAFVAGTLLVALCCLPASASAFTLRPLLTRRRAARACSPVRLLLDDDDLDFEEVDAMDTSDEWEAQEAAEAAWQAARRGNMPADDGLSVDEDAHMGFEAPEDPDELRERQLFEKRQAQLALLSGGAPPGPGGGDGGDALMAKRVLTALEGVLNALARMEEKMDRIEAAVASMPTGAAASSVAAGAAAAPSPPSRLAEDDDAPDGLSVDEEAYMYDDPNENLPDWRDARRQKKLETIGRLEASVAATPPAGDEAPKPNAGESPAAAAPEAAAPEAAAPEAAAPEAAAPEAAAEPPAATRRAARSEEGDAPDGLTVDETAYMYDDPDQDLADWRDVKRLNSLFGEVSDDP